ncbi:MAG: EamA/RhaT family transporter, partial [Chitinophagaceae bacterium]
VILAKIFLKERIGWLKAGGMLLCIAGVLFLLSKGRMENLLQLHFSTGDLWMLMAAFFFAVYNVIVITKPASISPVNFLFSSFLLGTVLLIPFFIWESTNHPSVQWNATILLSILYLGLGASVICFFIWNKAIRILGAGRTALFGNLIPIFSSIVAVIDPQLKEKFTSTHFISMLTVFAGLLLANLKTFR